MQLVSFLGNALAEIGRGNGQARETHLIDLRPRWAENLDRHTLGYPALMRPESEAVCQELESSSRLVALKPFSRMSRKYPGYLQPIVLIDATGEESVTNI